MVPRQTERRTAGAEAAPAAARPGPAAGAAPTEPRPAPAADRGALDALVRVSQMLAGNLDLETLLHAAMAAAEQALGAEACSILLQDREGRRLTFHIVDGPRTGGLAEATVVIDDHSIAGWVAAHQEALLIPEAYGDPRFNPAYDARTGFRTRSVVCVPLAAQGRPLGVMQVLNRRDGRPFDAQDRELAQAVGSLVATAMHNAQEHQARLQAERLATVGQTVAGMAHCVKNILNGLQAGSYVMDQNLGTDAPEGLAKGWKIVRRNMQTLSNIVLDMLNFSKDRKPIYQACRIGDLCQDVAALLQSQAAERSVTLVTSSDLAEVWVDEAGLRRCLINLVGNAIDACGKGGGTVEIEVGRAEGEGRCAIRVRDTGCGMDAATRERIFDPFFSTKGGRGTGLGLAVTKKVVEEHRGTIRVESTPGQGTEFVLVLPIEPPEGAGGTARRGPPAADPRRPEDKEPHR